MKKFRMKTLVTLCLTTLVLSSCAVKLDETERNDAYYSTIYRGKETHNFAVIYYQNERILENQKKILENQEKILKLLDER